MSDLPPFFTVEEAAGVVRIGRTLAYQLAARFEATNGAEGLPVLRIGRLLRVPRAALETWAGAELTATAPHPAPEQPDPPYPPVPPPPAIATPTPLTPATRRSPRATVQPRLPFLG